MELSLHLSRCVYLPEGADSLSLETIFFLMGGLDRIEKKPPFVAAYQAQVHQKGKRLQSESAVTVACSLTLQLRSILLHSRTLNTTATTTTSSFRLKTNLVRKNSQAWFVEQFIDMCVTLSLICIGHHTRFEGLHKYAEQQPTESRLLTISGHAVSMES